tara:strand:- start:134 stop:334 length:201 start_codon:yes stop_codon:yes gene_type:complete
MTIFTHKTPTQQQVNEFLDWLRMTGKTNMFGATPFVQEEFNLNEKDAKAFLVEWMKTFGERHNNES